MRATGVSRVKFIKMQGLGNDFVVIVGPMKPSSSLINAICDRREGVGADGVIVATRRGDAVQMEYWNADGTFAEMCANGLRCVAQLAIRSGWVDPSGFIVHTGSGEHSARRVGDYLVRAFVGKAHTLDRDVASCGVDLHTVTVGNPHAVTFVEDLANAPVELLGSDIEVDPQFANGTNVEFALIRSRSHIDLRVWERGVGETNACGTGAAATVFAAHERGHVDTTVTVTLPGGDLRIELTGEGVWMEGPAEFVFSGEWPET